MERSMKGCNFSLPLVNGVKQITRLVEMSITKQLRLRRCLLRKRELSLRPTSYLGKELITIRAAVTITLLRRLLMITSMTVAPAEMMTPVMTILTTVITKVIPTNITKLCSNFKLPYRPLPSQANSWNCYTTV